MYAGIIRIGLQGLQTLQIRKGVRLLRDRMNSSRINGLENHVGLTDCKSGLEGEIWKETSGREKDA